MTKQQSKTPGEISRHAFAAAKEAKRAADLSLTAAKAHGQSLRSRLASGDNTVTVEGIREADLATEVAGIVANREAGALRLAERGIVADETTLAACLVPVLEALLPGVPCELVNERPKTTTTLDGIRLYLLQRRPAVQDTIKGTLSGTVEVIYERSPLHSALRDHDVERVADTLGLGIRARGAGASGSGPVVGDVITVEVHFAYAEVPVIEDGGAAAMYVKSFVNGLASKLQMGTQQSSTQTRGVRLSGDSSSGDASAKTGSVHATASEIRWAGDRTDAKGIRTRIVAFDLAVSPGRGCWYTPVELQAVSVSAVERCTGSCVTALGRVVEAKVSTIEAVGRDGRKLSVEVAFASRLPG